jgi:6-phosphogluconolactonase
MTCATSHLGLYAAVGSELTHYAVSVAAGTLTRRGAVTLPANVQYGWPHASGQRLYVGCSDSPTGRGSFVGGNHSLTALAIDPASGALSQLDDPVALPSRPIHLTTDIPSEHILIALTNPSRVQVYRTNPDGSLGDKVRQADEIDVGGYAHQVRVRPDNRTVIVTDRGLTASGDSPPVASGCLRIFDYRGGKLARRIVVTPSGDYGFGPRHLDFHPSQPWVYVVLEAQNRLAMFAFDGTALRPICERDTLVGSGESRTRQAASTVHVHPKGGTVYVANRASSTTSIRSDGVTVGGENTIAVFAIDSLNGEPVRIQSIDAGGIHCRTFHIDPSGRLLVAAHAVGLTASDATGGQRPGSGCLALFRIGDDGTLSFLRKYDVEVGARQLFWMGMVGRAAAC